MAERTRFPVARHGGSVLMLALVAVLACDSPVVPARGDADMACTARDPGDFYDFAIPPTAQPNGETATAARILRWPHGAAIRVAVLDDEFIPEPLLADVLEVGADAWHRAVLYGEFTITPASGPETADVLLRWAGTPLPVEIPAPVCAPELENVGVMTRCNVDENPARLDPYPLEGSAADDSGSVRMIITISRALADEPDHLRKVVTHELGHAIGIMRHSPCSGDLMYAGTIETAVPSPADRATVQVLYHAVPDIRP